MKVLLFSCSTGGGHNSAAAALAQELEARSVKNRTYDALQFLPKSTADLISHGHDFAYRYAPKIYGAGYRREEKHPSSLFYEQSIRGIGPLYEELIDQAPDAVICVHPVSYTHLAQGQIEALTAAGRRSGLSADPAGRHGRP